jgi:hypothetical protein
MRKIIDYRGSAVSKPKGKGLTKKLTPMLILGIMMVVSAVATTGYLVASATLNITVPEAFEVSYAYITPAGACPAAASGSWISATKGMSFPITGYPGETATACVKIVNKGSNPLGYRVDYTSLSGGIIIDDNTCDDATTVSHGTPVICGIVAYVDSDVAPGNYSELIQVYRV